MRTGRYGWRAALIQGRASRQGQRLPVVAGGLGQCLREGGRHQLCALGNLCHEVEGELGRRSQGWTPFSGSLVLMLLWLQSGSDLVWKEMKMHQTAV